MDGVKHMVILKNLFHRKKHAIPFIETQKYHTITKRILTGETVVFKDRKIAVMAEWDCGATYSSISDDLVQALNLKPIKSDISITTNNSDLVNVYEVIVLLNNQYPVKVEAQAVSNINATGIDLLIGMDIISLGDFAISNYKGKTCFSFRIPSQNHIDFKNFNMP